MTTAELIAKLKGDDPDGVREVVIWDTDEELIKGVKQVELSDDRVVVEVAVSDKLRRERQSFRQALPAVQKGARPAESAARQN